MNITNGFDGEKPQGFLAEIDHTPLGEAALRRAKPQQGSEEALDSLS